VSPQLQQVLNEARQLPPQDLLMLITQLSGEVKRPTKIDAVPDDSPEERLRQRPEAELEYVDGVLVVKSQGQKLSGDLVAAMREDRMRQIGGW
jgi:hypothetical protein